MLVVLYCMTRFINNNFYIYDWYWFAPMRQGICRAAEWHYIFSYMAPLPASIDATTMFIWERKNCDWPLQGGRAAAMQIDHYNAKKLIIHCPCRIFFWCDWVIWLGESWIPSRWKFILGSYSALLWSWYDAFCSQPRGKASYVLS